MNTRPLGKFIVIEGGDFCGKTTFAEQLARVLGYRDFNCTLSRSPGGNTEGESIRKLLVNTRLDEATRTCIFGGNRVHLTNSLIKPLVKVGRNIIMTRWRWSADVYQDVPAVSDFIDETLGVAKPDVYVLLECSDEVMEKGWLNRESTDLMDDEYTQDYRKVKERYQQLYDNYTGGKFKFTYNEGTIVPTDREFIEKYKDLLDFLGYFSLPEMITVFEDEKPKDQEL